MLIYITTGIIDIVKVYRPVDTTRSEFNDDDTDTFDLPQIPRVDDIIVKYGKVLNVVWNMQEKSVEIFCVKENKYRREVYT